MKLKHIAHNIQKVIIFSSIIFLSGYAAEDNADKEEHRGDFRKKNLEKDDGKNCTLYSQHIKCITRGR